MKITLQVWRQKNANSAGRFERYAADNVSPDMSFLEMLDVVNEELIAKGQEPIAFEHDCREGICGSCGMMINGHAHGPEHMTTTCQLHMRSFKDGDEILIEPWRAKAFPIIKDLVVDRKALDQIIQAGGYVSVSTGSAPEANDTPVRKQDADEAMDAAACIGCGACVAACPNGSISLFLGAKITHLAKLPQGQPERLERVQRMVSIADDAGFGACTNHRECQAVCPKGIDVAVIAQLNRDLIRATLTTSEEKQNND